MSRVAGRFQPVVFRRTPKLIRQSDPEVTTSPSSSAGPGRLWGGTGKPIQPHDLYTNDSSRPYEIHGTGDPVTTWALEIPKALLPLPRDRAAG